MTTITERFNKVQERLQKRQQYYQQKQMQIDYAYQKNQHLTLEEKIKTKFRFKVPSQHKQYLKQETNVINVKKPKQQIVNSPVTQIQQLEQQPLIINPPQSPQIQNNSQLQSRLNTITEQIEQSLPNFNNYESLRFSSQNIDNYSLISNQKSLVDLQNNIVNTFRLNNEDKLQQLPKNMSMQQLQNDLSQQLQNITKSNTDQLQSLMQSKRNTLPIEQHSIQLLSNGQLSGSSKMISQALQSNNQPSMIEKATSMTVIQSQQVSNPSNLISSNIQAPISTVCGSLTSKTTDPIYSDENISLISIRRKKVKKDPENEVDITIGYCTKQLVPKVKSSQSYQSYSSSNSIQQLSIESKPQIINNFQRNVVSFQDNLPSNKSCITENPIQQQQEDRIQQRQNNYSYSVFQKQKSLQQQYREFLNDKSGQQQQYTHPELVNSQYLFNILKDNIITKLNK